MAPISEWHGWDYTRHGAYCRECGCPLVEPPEDAEWDGHFWVAPAAFWHLLEAATLVHSVATGHHAVAIGGMSFSGGFENWPDEYRPGGFIG